MANFKNPHIDPIADPINLDKWLQTLQTYIDSNLAWIDNAQFKVYKTYERRNGRVLVLPSVYVDKGKYLALDFNKNFKGTSFFVVNDPIEFTDYLPYKNASQLIAHVDLIVLFDLNKIRNLGGHYDVNYSFEEILQAELNQILRYFPALTLKEIQHEPEDVWNGFKIDHVEWQTFMYPRGGFRYIMDLDYSEECKEETITSLPEFDFEQGFLKL